MKPFNGVSKQAWNNHNLGRTLALCRLALTACLCEERNSCGPVGGGGGGGGSEPPQPTALVW